VGKPDDSTQASPKATPKRFQQVEVHADRLQTEIARAIQPTSLISAEALQTLGARQIPDALSFVPGVFVRNYGGLGGLKTVSLRGANAAQTLVLVDGVRVNSTQSGQVDMSMIPVSMIEELEVVRGGAAALYGAAAMGGVVNIRTKRSVNAGWKAQAELASFGEFVASVQGSVPLAMWVLTANAEWQRSQGNFPFLFNEFGRDVVLERTNGDFTGLSGRLQAAGNLDAWRVNAQTLVRSSERGAPGAVVQGSVEMARARLQEDEALTQLSATRTLEGLPTLASSTLASSTLGSLTLSASWRANTLRYRDPDARTRGPNGIDERFTGNDLAAKALVRSAGEVGAMQLLHEWAAEAVFSDVRGNFFQPDAGNYVRRINTSLAGKIEINAAQSRFHAGGRLDWFSDFGLVASPLAGVAFSPTSFSPTSFSPTTAADGAWTFRAQWSYNFRPPAFNELYYLNFGNQALKPERGHSVNLGSSFVASSLFSVEADAFANFTHNQIVAVPTSPVTWSAQNVGMVQTLGVEASIRAGFVVDAVENALSLQASFTFQRATDDTPGGLTRGRLLVYTPQVLANGILTWRPPSWLSAGVAVQYAGERYSLASNADNSLLPAFTVVNFHTEAALHIDNTDNTQVKIRLQCDNVFDTRYAVIRNFPMPGRALRLVCSVEAK
jgi:outer membrane cobalamin receptor